LAQSASAELREAVSDLAADGGTAKILVRRPRRGMGPKARRVEELLFPDRAKAREEKGKGRGKGKRGGKQQGGGGGGAPADAPAAGVGAGAGAGVNSGDVRQTYTGRNAADVPPASRRR
jgi:hypothetical protein